MTTQTPSAIKAGERLIAAVAQRDFSQLADVLTPDVRLRALIPPGLVELADAERVTARFSSWFDGLEQLELIRSGSEPVGDRLHVFYRLRVTDDDVPRLVEQHLLCTLVGDRIDGLDLVCTGFRPDTKARLDDAPRLV